MVPFRFLNVLPKQSRVLLSLACLFFMVGSAFADDWPQFRGPNRDGISGESGWSTDWSKEGLPILWKVSVGRGYSSVSVVKNRLYTIGLITNQDKKDAPTHEVVQCLDVDTGKPIWNFVCSTSIQKSFPGARSTPTVHGNHVYVYGQGGELYCLDADSGKVVWQKFLMTELAALKVIYGYAASPLILGDLVMVPARILKAKPTKDIKPNADGLLLAFEKKTGKEVWRVYHPSAEIGGGYWACPTACTINDKPCLVYSSGNAILGIDPMTGKMLWKYEFSAEDLKTKTGHKGITAQEPVVLGDRIICCIHPDNSDGVGVCLEVKGTEVKEVWRDRLLDHYTCCNIIWKDHVFGITHNDTASRIGPLYCIEVKTGKIKWQQNKVGGAFTLVDNKFLTFDGRELTLIEASTEGFKELGRSQKLFSQKESAFPYSDRIAPVLANGRLYCRNQDGYLVCLDVRKK